MKKTLILSLCGLGLLASCQKEHQKQKTVNVPALGARHLSALPTYTLLTLQSDGSYEGYWHSCGIKVTNPSWDRLKYPTLVNGVPVLAQTITTYDGTSTVTYLNTGPAGNIFQVFQEKVQLSVLNADSLNSDMTKFTNALNDWMDAGSVGMSPVVSDYVKPTYTVYGDGVMNNTYTGKLIRVTTGSNLAIADISYPMPASTAPPAGSLTCTITDPATHISYTVKGLNDLLTSAKNVGGTSYPVTGTYTTDSAGNIIVIGTIFGASGTFNFDVTLDI